MFEPKLKYNYLVIWVEIKKKSHIPNLENEYFEKYEKWDSNVFVEEQVIYHCYRTSSIKSGFVDFDFEVNRIGTTSSSNLLNLSKTLKLMSLSRFLHRRLVPNFKNKLLRERKKRNVKESPPSRLI